MLQPQAFFNSSPDSSNLTRLAEQCVFCGLCVPHCPTYRITGSEADSPRGRVVLMRGLLQDQVPLNQTLLQHLDRCLACRACERVCPSGVKYGKLLDGIRSVIATPSSFRKPLRNILGGRSLTLNLLGYGLWIYQRSGLRWLGRKMGVMKPLGFEQAEQELPDVFELPRWKRYYPAKGNRQGEVVLFLGCMARFSDVETLKAAIYVLNQLGYGVHVPKDQRCCGAMHLHGGESEKAVALAKHNMEVFSGMGEAFILSTASGCSATLHEYADLLNLGESTALQFQDINDFLLQAEGWEQCQIKPCLEKIRVHDPCTLRNVLREENRVYSLLAKIPDLQVEPLEGNDQCCGAAGLYHLEQPEMAGLLRDDKIQSIKASGAEKLVTSNIGCAMWLAQEAGIEILHPVVLLARQMGFTGYV